VSRLFDTSRVKGAGKGRSFGAATKQLPTKITPKDCTFVALFKKVGLFVKHDVLQGNKFGGSKLAGILDS